MLLNLIFHYLTLILMIKSSYQQKEQDEQHQLQTKSFLTNIKTVVIDPCASNPCVNGMCRVLSFGFYCECLPIYEGVNCNRFKNSYCPNNPCQNNGTCTSHNGYEPFTCECKRPYTGVYCESLPDLKAVEEVRVDEFNSIYLMNQTLTLLNNPAKKLTSDYNEITQDKRLEILSNLISGVIKTKRIAQDRVRPDFLISMLDFVINNAISSPSDYLINSTDRLQQLSQIFEQYVTTIKVQSSEYYTKSTPNLAVLTFTVNNTNSVSTGFVLPDANTTSNMVLVKDATQVDFSTVKVSSFLDVNLLKSITNKTSKPSFSFMVYESSILFDVNSSLLQLAQEDFNCSELPNNQIVTNVVSVNSDRNLSQFNNTNFVKTFFRTLPTTIRCTQSRQVKYKCVYWNYETSEWSSNGCTYSYTSEDLHACDCNHMTNFAVLMTFDGSSDSDCQICQSILKYSTYFGNGLSILGLVITIIVYTKDIIKKKITRSNSITFKSMFDYYIEILVSLSASLLAMNVLYIIFSVITWKSNLLICMIIGVLLHYFLLSSFSWMLCFSILQYLTFNKVLFVINKYYLKSAIFSLSLPLIPISIVLAIDWKLYQNPKFYCWLSSYSAVYAILLPILLILIINIFVFTLIMKKHCTCRFKASLNQSSEKLLQKETNIRRQTIIFMTCFLNLGLTWIMGFLLIIPLNNEWIRTAIAFLFCLFNSLQGFFLFVIYVLVSRSRRIYMKYATSEKLKKQFSTEATTTLKTTINTTRTENDYNNQSNNDNEVYFITPNNYYSKL